MASQRALYTGHDERKLAALPGLTSLAVGARRNDIPWKQRVAMDIRYIERWTLWLDLRILVMTLAMRSASARSSSPTCWMASRSSRPRAGR